MSWSIIIAALLLDQMLGEARRFHPLVGFGNCASWLEKHVNTHQHRVQSILFGLVSLLLLVLPWVFVSALFGHYAGPYYIIVDVLILYWALGLKSLKQHVSPIQTLLISDKIAESREALSRIVSRDTSNLDARQISSATIESTLENGCDSLFGALFWYLLGGAPLVVAYRLINTLDAMWGYRTARFENFGKAAAKLDDVLNYVPARLTALSYAVCGNTVEALNSWQTYAHQLASPNAGPVMSAGAGALNLQLGGDAFYHQRSVSKPTFGGTNVPHALDIQRAVNLVTLSTVLWCALGILGTLIIWFAL